MSSIRSILKDDFLERFDQILANSSDHDKLQTLSASDKKTLHNAVLCNAEVERSFSVLKNLISDRRHNKSDETVERCLSVQFNAHLLFDEQ